MEPLYVIFDCVYISYSIATYIDKRFTCSICLYCLNTHYNNNNKHCCYIVTVNVGMQLKFKDVVILDVYRSWPIIMLNLLPIMLLSSTQ